VPLRAAVYPTTNVAGHMKCFQQNNKPQKGSFRQIAAKFHVHPRTIKRIWERGQESVKNGSICANISTRFKGSTFRKDLSVAAKVKEVPLRLPSTIRSLAKALEIPESTLHDRFKRGELRRHSSAIKPLLTESNKVQRLEFCCSFVLPKEPCPVFHDMLDVVHVDEKWFNLKKVKQTFYLAADVSEQNLREPLQK
jgi:hypothetical protein